MSIIINPKSEIDIRPSSVEVLNPKQIQNPKSKIQINLLNPNNLMIWILMIYLSLVGGFWSFPAFGQAPAEEQKVSLHFKGVEIKDALLQLAEEAKINIIGVEEVEGRITVFLENVPLTAALSAILKGSGYSYEMDEKGILRIVPSATPAKMIEMTKGLVAQTFTANYTEPDNIKEAISPLLPEGTNIIIPKGTKTLLIQGKIGAIKMAKNLIRSLDLPPRQVMVEAQIIEVTHTTEQKQGVEIGYTNPKDPNDYVKTVGLAGTSSDTYATGLYFSISTLSLEAAAESYRYRKGYNLLSSPRVLAIEGKKAELITGQRLGYKTKTVTTTGLIESIEFMDVGTKLTIQPAIKDDGTIIMEVHPEVSTGQISNDLPQKDSTETTTTLAVKDGQTIIIGGLLKDYAEEVVKGVPILMDIPLLGTFFRYNEIDTQKRELIVLISPHLVDAEEIARQAQEIEALNRIREKSNEFSPLRPFR